MPLRCVVPSAGAAVEERKCQCQFGLAAAVVGGGGGLSMAAAEHVFGRPQSNCWNYSVVWANWAQERPPEGRKWTRP